MPQRCNLFRLRSLNGHRWSSGFLTIGADHFKGGRSDGGLTELGAGSVYISDGGSETAAGSDDCFFNADFNFFEAGQ